MANIYDWENGCYISTKKKKRKPIIYIYAVFVLAVICVILLIILLLPNNKAEDLSISDTDLFSSKTNDMSISENTGIPEWIVQDFLPVNDYSRPGTSLGSVNGVVVHYTGNPGTTAEQNRSYFENLAQTHKTKASSHFIIGIDGKTIQCVPLDEISYCSNHRNIDTIAIECCHPDDSGEFTQETKDSLIKLLNWLVLEFDLKKENILRHFDVSGKECPRYYVLNPDEWRKVLLEIEFD